MPRVESSTRIAYSKMRRDGSDRNSVDSTSVTAEPIRARIFMKRAKSSTMKLPPKVTCLPAGSMYSSTPTTIRSSTASVVTVLVVSCPR
jgi:hypothetical protein